MQQISAAAGQTAGRLWNVAGAVTEVFQRTDGRAVLGVVITDQSPGLGATFAGRVQAQLTHEGHLTSAGGEYCRLHGVEATPDALKRWAALPEPAHSPFRR